MRRIIKLFEQGNVSVCGLKGAGKDMLFANVVVRRNKKYVSNTNYGGDWIPFDPAALDCNNTWQDFMTGKLYHYDYPYEDGTDFYIADGGVYMPSQYQGELCKDYGHVPIFMALSRHLGDANVHYNVQNLNRMWDKIREQSDTYIRCIWCFIPAKHIKKIKTVWLRDFLLRIPLSYLVFQKVIIYEKYESAVNRVPPFRLSRPWFNQDRIQQWEIQQSNYDIAHGTVIPRILIYFNRSNYNTRVFKEMLENAIAIRPASKRKGAVSNA